MPALMAPSGKSSALAAAVPQHSVAARIKQADPCRHLFAAVCRFVVWCLPVVWDLVIGAWDFGFLPASLC
jgi:hypothetical protein